MAMDDLTLADGPRPITPRADAATTPSAGRATGIPTPGQSWGRYRVEAVLGEGGMGRVYAAFDPALERRVALKVLRSAEPGLVERFTAEARAQARIEHDHVCRVYEVGEVDGAPYIAMQLVLGGTLRQPPEDLPLLERVAALAQVAEAVHAAHKSGLIHRDIKPGNILLERNENGRYRPFVADFGIARAVDSAGLTRTGTLIGTVGYMAPEQVLGGDPAPDRRMDVYGLGATLYELVCGSPPYAGSNEAQVLLQVITEDPVPLSRRRSGVAKDLETIVMRCLERDPARRYESARALAEDLRRFVDGEPILARPASFGYRLAKRLQKSKRLAAVVAVAVLTSLTLLGLWLNARWQAGRQAALAQRFGEEAQRIEGDLRIARLLPLHDTAPERSGAHAAVDRLETQIREGGRLAVGPGRYALGRAYLALDEPEQARTELERALAAGYRGPQVHTALGLALGSLYQRALDRAAGLADREQQEKERQRAERELRDPALAELRSAGASGGDPTYVEGLIAFYDRRFDEALAKARESFARQPSLYEAKRLEGDTLVARGLQQADRGADEEALASCAAAAEPYRVALSIGRSDAALLLAECQRRLRVLVIEARRGGAAEPAFNAAVEACRQPLAANSELAESPTQLAFAHWTYADFIGGHGGDPRPLLAQAERFAAQALELAPDNATAASHAGTAAVLAAEYEIGRGLDPRPALARAIASFDRALALDPGMVLVYNEKGLAYYNQGDYELLAGLDPRASFESAVAAYEQALARVPDYANAIHNLALALDHEADYETAIGIDPTPRRQRAIDNYQHAIALAPNRGLFLTNLGGAFIKQGDFQLSRGMAPSASIEGAIAVLTTAVQLDPQRSIARGNLSNAYLLQGEHEFRSGKDPRSALRHCVELNEQVLTTQPSSALAHGTLGQAWLAIARYEQRIGLDPRRSLGNARQALAACIAINPLFKNQLASSLEEIEQLLSTARR